MTPAGAVEDGMIACRDGRIVYAGARADAPEFAATGVIDCAGRWITPGLIDCHTHLVHAGSRAHEFELRLAGASYEEIARAGGGIVSTMKATRAASEEALVASALPRLDALLAEGVTTIEIKSGYGLSLADELKMLRAARQLGAARAVTVRTSLLAAHALPPEFADDADGYIEHICAQIIPATVGLADAVDGFCETIGFTPDQIERVFAAARTHGLPVKLHAEQLSNSHGAALAARYDALSADHLEHLDDAGIAAMARASTVAVLLPGAYYFTRETQPPPIAKLRAAGVPIALATDCNPGTSPLTSLLLAMNMGATLFRLTVEECLAGVTREAARALGLLQQIGTLEAGKACDLAIWDIERPAELVYRIGANPLHARIHKGVCV
ncbi:MAG TPA: imidazolonepropionase [Novosphingobium sp.]|nr:imidazolonepropionase [Novosphingobium sp.]